MTGVRKIHPDIPNLLSASIITSEHDFFLAGPKNQESVVLVGQKSVIYYIQVVVVALLSVDLVESVDLVSVYLVVNCTQFLCVYLIK